MKESFDPNSISNGGKCYKYHDPRDQDIGLKHPAVGIRVIENIRHHRTLEPEPLGDPSEQHGSRYGVEQRSADFVRRLVIYGDKDKVKDRQHGKTQTPETQIWREKNVVHIRI